MAYEILDCTSTIRYLLSLPHIAEFFGVGELTAREIGDGNLNQVFIVERTSDPSRSLVLKQALPYLRCVGESYPLDRSRMLYEIRSLLQSQQLCPKHTPKIYHTDEQMSLVVMQNLNRHIIMRKGIIEGVKYPLFSEHISDFLANTLFFTSSLALQSGQKRLLMGNFLQNTQLCKLTEDFVFTLPYMEHETNRHDRLIDKEVRRIRASGEFKLKAMELKNLFMNNSEALIHGDLHTGSIMLNESETFIIDSEFAFFGPIGFDVGAVYGNLLMGVAAARAREMDDYATWLQGVAIEVLQKFSSKFRALWDAQEHSALFSEKEYWKGLQKEREEFKDGYMRRILQDTAGFAGCKMMRRQMGIAHVLDIDSIEDEKSRAKAQKEVIATAERFVMQHRQINCIDDVVKLAKDAK